MERKTNLGEIVHQDMQIPMEEENIISKEVQVTTVQTADLASLKQQLAEKYSNLNAAARVAGNPIKDTGKEGATAHLAPTPFISAQEKDSIAGQDSESLAGVGHNPG